VKDKPTGWRPPTRRTFVAMLAAAAAALAVRTKAAEPKPLPTWIGHC
jgi:hypothetical protein